MLKFIKGHMSTIADISIYPVMGFVLFFTMFIIATWYVMTTSKARINYMGSLPFNDNEKNEQIESTERR
jgi:cytochrome c oxidase cbb3-type subunit IV